MNNTQREQSIEVLRHYYDHDPQDVFDALYLLRRNAEHGDESYIYPLLDHDVSEIVGSAIYSLCSMHGQRAKLRPLLFRLAGGDPRDYVENPIQHQAIFQLSQFGRNDQEVVDRLVEIALTADKGSPGEVHALRELAEMFHLDWSGKYTEELILNPSSDYCQGIRKNILEGVARARDQE